MSGTHSFTFIFRAGSFIWFDSRSTDRPSPCGTGSLVTHARNYYRWRSSRCNTTCAPHRSSCFTLFSVIFFCYTVRKTHSFTFIFRAGSFIWFDSRSTDRPSPCGTGSLVTHARNYYRWRSSRCNTTCAPHRSSCFTLSSVIFFCYTVRKPRLITCCILCGRTYGST